MGKIQINPNHPASLNHLVEAPHDCIPAGLFTLKREAFAFMEKRAPCS